jgi:hypothetical protein
LLTDHWFIANESVTLLLLAATAVKQLYLPAIPTLLRSAAARTLVAVTVATIAGGRFPYH